MKTWIALLACLSVLGLVPVQAQTPVATGLDSVAWDYPDSSLTAGAVVRFDVCLDATPCVSRTVAEAKHPTLGASVYFWKLPAMLPGNHTVAIKACNADLCSPPLELSFRFAVEPPPVSNPRLIKG
jgi:hypothetical protein